jgi:restriction system protein
MSIPDYQSIMLPLLRFAGDAEEHSLREAIDALADEFNLSQEERKELLPSGRQDRFSNRVGWARTYMKKALLLEYTRRGYFRVTGRGQEVLSQDLLGIDNAYLRQFPEFVKFQSRRRSESVAKGDADAAATDQTPEEAVESAFQQLREDLAADLIEVVKSCSPDFFERLVIDLLLKMGYGGTRRDAGQAIGRSGDAGIDGIIKEDRLGLDTVYIQAKRWEDSVSRPEIQKFAGALQGQRARKGIFITTSTYTSGAQEYVKYIDSKIVLIDGDMLAQLMIDHNIGVSPITAYELKRIDSDYFNEE